MLIRVLILSPFRFIHGNKNVFYQAGDCVYLNNALPEDREELKAFLHPMAEHRSWVWIEEGLVADLIEELEGENQGDPLPSTKEPEVSEDPTPSDFTNPPSDPKENPFVDSKPEAADSIEEVVKEKKGVEEEEEVELESIDLTAEPKEEPKELRRKELSELHWKTLSKIAKGLGLEYTHEAETIEKILEIEFKS